MELRISVSGDPDGGWLVDVHDGDVNEVYRPDDTHKTAAMAAMFALTEHCPELESDLKAREDAMRPADPIPDAPAAWEPPPPYLEPANDPLTPGTGPFTTADIGQSPPPSDTQV